MSGRALRVGVEWFPRAGSDELKSVQPGLPVCPRGCY